MKKALLVILWLILSCILPACGTSQTYEQMSDEAAATGDHTKVDAFEKKAEKASIFFENKRACLRHPDAIWYCSNGMSSNRNRRNKGFNTVEQQVRAYDRERMSGCRCAEKFSNF